MNPTPHGRYLAIGTAITVILSIGVGFALFELVRIERNLNTSAAASAETLALVNTALKGTHKNGDDGLLVLARVLLQNSDGAANALKQTLQDANRIAKQEQPKTAALADSSLAAVRAGGEVVVKLGAAVDMLNGVIGDVRTTTLPKLNAGVDSLNGLVADLRPTATASTDLVTQAAGVVGELKGTVSQANALLADPDIAATAANLASMSANLNGAALHANHALGYIEADLTPKKLPFWQAVVSTALSEAIGIPLKYLPQAVTVVSTVPVPKK
jgi:hypothetical protein